MACGMQGEVPCVLLRSALAQVGDGPQNFLAGLLLRITQPFQIGDQIAATGLVGTVEDIQTRATFIRTCDDRRV